MNSGYDNQVEFARLSPVLSTEAKLFGGQKCDDGVEMQCLVMLRLMSQAAVECQQGTEELVPS
jgi:hypothetical protein